MKEGDLRANKYKSMWKSRSTRGRYGMVIEERDWIVEREVQTHETMHEENLP